MEPVRNGSSYQIVSADCESAEEKQIVTLYWNESDGESYTADYDNLSEMRKEHPGIDIIRLKQAEKNRNLKGLE